MDMQNFNFVPFKKIPRLSRDMVVTEKLDGTNASITITEDGQFLTASRNRWITPEDDNYGFSKWAHANMEELMKLGVGTHFGEWWGKGIQRGYDVPDKRFSLFNVAKDPSTIPPCCSVVPIIFKGPFTTENIDAAINELCSFGSKAAPGFEDVEGVVIWHEALQGYFKKTCVDDGISKSEADFRHKNQNS